MSADFSSADNTLSGRYGTNNSRYGGADGNDNSLRYQDDQLKTAAGAAGGGAAQWGTSSTSSKTKTSTRTYTEADGTVVTEEITEKDGVIERKVRRHKQETRITVSATGGDDIDYDKALADAIQSVTNMDQGLSVEKIEIHTKSETAH